MTTTITPPTEQRITELNDLCRQAMGVTGRVFQTQRHSALPPSAQSAIREKVELFDDFTEDNDPHGEQDFGAFEHEGERKSATTPPTWNTAARTPPIRNRRSGF